ncbi:MAG: hypothetical protein EXR79_08595 [Myxococcales bacterium]|nr:hypothetical protein [Myxococcales bacterium]
MNGMNGMDGMDGINGMKRTLRRLGMAGVLVVALGACDRPCRQLGEQLCVRAGSDDSQCDRWRDRVKRVAESTCEAGLRILDRERAR